MYPSLYPLCGKGSGFVLWSTHFFLSCCQGFGVCSTLACCQGFYYMPCQYITTSQQWQLSSVATVTTIFGDIYVGRNKHWCFCVLLHVIGFCRNGFYAQQMHAKLEWYCSTGWFFNLVFFFFFSFWWMQFGVLFFFWSK